MKARTNIRLCLIADGVRKEEIFNFSETNFLDVAITLRIPVKVGHPFRFKLGH